MVEKRKRRDDRISQILSAARQLLETKGLVGSSVAEIALVADVSEATVFSYFKTRRDLMFRVISDWMEPVIDRLEKDVPSIVGLRPRLVYFLGRHLRELAEAPELHQLIYRELHWENYYGSELHRLNQRYARLVSWIVDDGKRVGEVAQGLDTDIARDIVFGTLHHVGWRTFMNDRPVDIDATAEAIAAQILCGVGASPAANAPTIETVVARLEAVATKLDTAARVT